MLTKPMERSVTDSNLASGAATAATAQVKPVALLEPRCVMETRADGVRVLRCHEPLAAYPAFLTDRLEFWAEAAPDRIAFAQRDADDRWRQINYRELLQAVQAVGEALVARGLSAHRPVAILSENDIEQAILVLACQYVGVPVVPVSPSYALISQDFERLRHVIGLVRPGLIFANDTARFRPALGALDLGDAEIVCASATPAVANATRFRALMATPPGAAGQAAQAARRPDDTAKILFTSGSTGTPKGVINTHRMIAANQQMVAQVYRFLQTEPPVILDWLPWHHTFGGNHNFGLAVYNGGTFYIDDGKPTPTGMAKTVRNLMEISPTAYFNVPRGYADLIRYLDRDPELASRFFRRLNMLFYSGAALDQTLWDALGAAGIRATGYFVPMLTSLGSTETAPMSISSTHIAPGPGEVGLPAPGVEAKLVPLGEKLELRLRGPHVMPGYLGRPELTAACFDEEGFYLIGDAVKFVDPADLDRGLAFDGRMGEDFKLNTGTWVNVAAVKARLIAAFAPYVRDAVIVGADRGALAALLIPDRAQIETFGTGADGAWPARIQATLDAMPARASSERVDRVAILTDELSLDAGEVTDKGSINPRKISANRAPLVEALYRLGRSDGWQFVRTSA
jgi:feruloyl-CoA synthase